jgi:hypothetical protein
MKSKGRYIMILLIAAVLLICGVFSNYANAGFRWGEYGKGWGPWGKGCNRSGADDIDGEVGHPIAIASPSAYCNGEFGNWTAAVRIVSGQLPPGLHFDGRAIVGIPTERGHWIVRLELYNVQCGGDRYEGFEQELRFHISGSGKVVE